MRDDTPVLVRPVRPDDATTLRAAYAELSPASRFSRFGTGVPRLTDAQVRYLTHVDQHDHLAIGAVLRDDPGTGLGIARCVRLPDEPQVAEAAVTVVDGAQSKGLGTLLLALLAQLAQDAGITTFRCYVLSENVRVLQLLDDLGAMPAEEESDGLARVDVPVPEVAALVRDTAAGRLLGAVSRQRLRPIDRRFPPVFSDAGEGAAPPAGDARAELQRWLERALELLPASSLSGDSTRRSTSRE